MAKKKLTVEQVAAALEQSHGLKTPAADLLGVKFDTLERYVKASPTLQAKIAAMRHKRTDRAKIGLDAAIERGESWAIIFTLRAKIDPDGEFVGEANRVDVTSKGNELGADDRDTRSEILRKLALIAAATGAGEVPNQPDGSTDNSPGA
jgi:hypothetical protein